MSFESDIAKISDPTHAIKWWPCDISQLSHTVTQFDWLRYINKILSFGRPSSVTVTEDERVYYARNYVTNFLELISSKAEYTPK